MREKLPKYYFNTPDFIASRTHPPVHTFEIEDKCYATFYESEGTFLSNYRATFGGIELANSVSSYDIDQIIISIESQARQSACTKIQISSWPAAYDETNYLLQKNRLIEAGFQVLYTDTNFHIPITEQAFIDTLHVMEKRKLKKAINANLSFQQENNPGLADDFFDLIVENRAYRGNPVSVDKPQLIGMLANPSHYPVFTVRSEGELLALCVCIRISADKLYTFMPADKIEARSLSPNVFQHFGLYNYCHANGIAILDLGTCGAKGIRNEGVALFKTRIGAQKSLKETFIKTF